MAPSGGTPCDILFFFLPLFFMCQRLAATSPPLSFNFDFSNTSKYRLRDLRFRQIIQAVLFFLLLLSFLSHHVVAASPPISFSFDFSNTSSYPLDDLRFEGDATLNGDLVDLTCNPINNYCSGRMSYNQPVPLYDNITGEIASFVTTFTFAINLVPKTTKKGEGMTFFLSGYPSRLPPGSSGNLLGLKSSNIIPSGADRFLAVEFDTSSSSSTSTGTQFTSDHIGINVNSITSVNKTRLPPGYSLNGTMTATITFDNATRTLEATLHFDGNNSIADAQVKARLPDDLSALLPPEVAVGFSAATGEYSELHQLYSWSFNSTMVARDTPKRANTVVHPGLGRVLRIIVHRYRRELLIGGLVMLALAVLLVIWSILSWSRLERMRRSFGKESRLKPCEYRDLSIATNGFSKEIGRGMFGVVYYGSLKNKKVAVKKILKDSTEEFKDFFAELGTVGDTVHMNVVRLESWCCSINNFMFWCLYRQKVKLFLVYELVPNGNLHEHLYERQEVLSWETRFKIVNGLCSALHYLHHQCSKVILHRDIKPSNILLDNVFNSKLGDFGLSRVVQDSSKRSVQTRAVGTELYMDPLCMKDGKIEFGPSADVYSVGIVLLEIVHGKYDMELFRKMRTDHRPGTFMNDFADQKLAGLFDREQMERVIILGLQCSEPADASKRPSLDGAILQFLEKGGELPPAIIHQDKPHTASGAHS